MSLNLSSNYLDFEIGMSEGSKNGIYEFDRFRLDSHDLMLYRDGAEVSLPPKVVSTLVVLVENRGSILTKDELIDKVWTDAVVEESNLSQHLYQLRKTLGKTPDGKSYIETLRRRGYRFNGDVRVPRKAAHVSSEPVPVPVPGIRPRTTVEREGNVLKVVDWTPAIRPEAVESVEQSRVPANSARRPVLALGALIAALLAVLAFVWFQPSVTPPVNAAKEMSVERLTNGIAPADATISPDGDYVVYHETDGEISRLWLQQVGRPDRIEIAEPTRKIYSGKTFSPDGKFIYFSLLEGINGASALYRVPAIGGPQAKLLDDLVYTVSFSPDGNRMTFLRLDRKSNLSQLVIAESDGRNQKVVLHRDGPGQLVGGPAWSPDGNLIAFAEADLSGPSLSGTIRLFTVNVAHGGVQQISVEKWDTVYRMVWTHAGDGIVMIGTREKEGTTTRRDQVYYVSYPDGVSKRITTDGVRHQIGSLGVTRDDAIIAVPFNRSSQIWSVAPDGDPASAVQLSKGLSDGRPGLAPMASGSVAYVARSGDDLNIWVMNADGSSPRQIAGGITTAEELRADPQGKFFVFAANVDGHHHLFRVENDGSGERQLTFGDGYEGDSAISPDGNWIVYGSTVIKGAFGRTTLWKIRSEGGDPSEFLSEECASPWFSPDGALMSCIRNDNEIVVLSAAGTQVESYKLPSNATVHFGAGWTLDGRGLAFIRGEGHSSNVWVQPRDGRKPYRLTNFKDGVVNRFAFAPDGSRLYVARGYPIADVILIRNYR
ncbi:MAG TPA: winged helix-turn-helix domain-containing protein [Pyrinomonadaceae bacterium]|nr:winged helix-turn-helix domain-containing protein [Pyrinomonadaceae bacterium]